MPINPFSSKPLPQHRTTMSSKHLKEMFHGIVSISKHAQKSISAPIDEELLVPETPSHKDGYIFANCKTEQKSDSILLNAFYAIVDLFKKGTYNKLSGEFSTRTAAVGSAIRTAEINSAIAKIIDCASNSLQVVKEDAVLRIPDHNHYGDATVLCKKENKIFGKTSFVLEYESNNFSAQLKNIDTNTSGLDVNIIMVSKKYCLLFNAKTCELIIAKRHPVIKHDDALDEKVIVREKLSIIKKTSLLVQDSSAPKRLAQDKKEAFTATILTDYLKEQLNIKTNVITKDALKCKKDISSIDNYEIIIDILTANSLVKVLPPVLKSAVLNTNSLPEQTEDLPQALKSAVLNTNSAGVEQHNAIYKITNGEKIFYISVNDQHNTISIFSQTEQQFIKLKTGIITTEKLVRFINNGKDTSVSAHRMLENDSSKLARDAQSEEGKISSQPGGDGLIQVQKQNNHALDIEDRNQPGGDGLILIEVPKQNNHA